MTVSARRVWFRRRCFGSGTQELMRSVKDWKSVSGFVWRHERYGRRVWCHGGRCGAEELIMVSLESLIAG